MRAIPGYRIIFSLQIKLILNCRRSIESSSNIYDFSVYVSNTQNDLIEQILSPIRELLITAKTRLPLLYPSGYLPWGHYYEMQAQQVGQSTDFLSPLEVCIALSYSIKARKLCH